MGSISSKNRGVKHLLSVIDVFIKYTWIKALTDQKSNTVLNDFIKIVKEENITINLWKYG